MLNQSARSQRLSTLALAVASLACAAPVHAETRGLAIGNYVSSAAFPCAPELQRRLVARTEVGDIRFTGLTCTQGDNAYLLGVTEYPAPIISALSVDEMLDSTLDDARSKHFIRIKSSERAMHEGLPSIRSHLLDSRKPRTEAITVAALADRTIVVVQVTAPAHRAQSKASTDFLNSLEIAAKK
jgi:hypothetical protein